MLEVVHHQQHMFLVQIADDLYARVFVTVEGELERAGDSRGDQVGRTDWGERYEADAVVKVRKLLGGSLESKPSFADAAWPDERQQAAGRIGQQDGDLGLFFGATDEGGRGGGQTIREHTQPFGAGASAESAAWARWIYFVESIIGSFLNQHRMVRVELSKCWKGFLSVSEERRKTCFTCDNAIILPRPPGRRGTE